MIMLHGRGASPESILELTPALHANGFAYLAPTAAGHTWYPYRFIEPISRNEPYLSSALNAIDALVTQVVNAGISHERIVLLGFSQGACLTLEYAARHAQRYGGVIGLSGGLIGDTVRVDYPGSLAETPVFLGCSDIDAHIPKERVIESAAVLRKLGGAVTDRLYRGMAHTVNDDEVAFVQGLVAQIANSPKA
jgi:predicted esterase